MPIKKIFSWVVIFCFLTSIFHFHPHIDQLNEEFSENITDYKNDVDHYSSNECDNCLIENNKSELFYIIKDICNLSPILLESKSEVFLKNGSCFFNVYSRPPPLSIS